jgi:hypothetical protein
VDVEVEEREEWVLEWWEVLVRVLEVVEGLRLRVAVGTVRGWGWITLR